MCSRMFPKAGAAGAGRISTARDRNDVFDVKE